MVHFIEGVITGTLELPLLNDSANQITNTPKTILNNFYTYVEKDKKKEISIQDQPINNFREAGLFVWRNNKNDYLVFDYGKFGPDFLVGHAHCDTLSFQLMIESHWIFTDSGVYEYEEGHDRNYFL